MRTDRDNGPGHVGAADPGLGGAEAEAHDAHQVRLAGHQVPVAHVDARSTDADEHVILAGRGSGDGRVVQDLSGAVPVLEIRVHGARVRLDLVVGPCSPRGGGHGFSLAGRVPLSALPY